MKIAVHAKVLSEKELSGIGYYTLNLLRALSRIDQRNRYVLYSNEPVVHKIQASNFEERILHFPKFWSYFRLPWEFVFEKFDLLFIPKEMVPIIYRPKTVAVCYDLGMPEYNISFDAKVHFWIATNFALRAADKVIAISKSTRADIVAKCGIPEEQVCVTPLGYDAELYRPVQDEGALDLVRKKYGIRGRYLINTSSLLWYRKNISRVVRAFHAFRSRSLEDIQLIITGKDGEASHDVQRLIEILRLQKDVILTGYVPIEDMPLLLNGAEALVFPSLHEGFGLPLIEAMACGCPVITSNCSAMPEVAGDAAILVDPLSENEICKACTAVSTSPEVRKRLVERGLRRVQEFTWERTARMTLNAFEETLRK